MKKFLIRGVYLASNGYTITIDKVLDSPKKRMKYKDLTKGVTRKRS